MSTYRQEFEKRSDAIKTMASDPSVPAIDRIYAWSMWGNMDMTSKPRMKEALMEIVKLSDNSR